MEWKIRWATKLIPYNSYFKAEKEKEIISILQ
jgi:hypothetical protein